MTNCSIEDVIRLSDRVVHERYRQGDTADIIETIMYADGQSERFIKNVTCLYGKNEYETLRNVFNFVKKNLRYRADRPGHERVKSPGALFAEGKGDCKSYSIAIGAILREMGIPYKYRFVAYGPGDVTHVYIVAQAKRGPVLLDAVHGKFDEEVRYYYKKDIRPKSGISGISEVSIDFSKYLFLGGILIFGYILMKKE